MEPQQNQSQPSNQMPQPPIIEPQPPQTIPTPQQLSPQVAVEPTGSLAKYWLLYTLFYALYIGTLLLVSEYFPVAAKPISLVFVVVIIFAVKHSSQLKKLQTDEILTASKRKAMLLLFLEPLVVQAIYYFRLKKTHPKVASTINNIGWKAFWIDFVATIIVFMTL